MTVTKSLLFRPRADMQKRVTFPASPRYKTCRDPGLQQLTSQAVRTCAIGLQLIYNCNTRISCIAVVLHMCGPLYINVKS